MTKDRLEELRAALSDDEDDLCIGVEEKSKYVDDFFQEVEQIKENISKMQESVTQVEEIYSHILSAPQTDEKQRQLHQDLEADIKLTSNRIRIGLKTMEKGIEELAQTSYMSADYRIRKTQHSMLLEMFAQTMNVYKKIQLDYREGIIARIKRQSSIAGRHISEDDIEINVENGGILSFTQDIVTDTQIARHILADIEARHHDIIKLETSIKELHDMFMDLSLLSECQGQLIDNIEYHVQQSYDYINVALRDTIAAHHAQNQARRKKLLIIICLMILVIVLLFIVSGLLGF